MNTHHILYSPNVAFAAPEVHNTPDIIGLKLKRRLLNHAADEIANALNFRTITHADMPQIWEILKNAPGRTTDFSYGGLLMWVDYFHYEFAIVRNTLFIKGRVESDISKVAFSMPIGQLPLPTCIAALRKYCRRNDIPLILSAVPEECLPEFDTFDNKIITPLIDWSDYLYEAQNLATLSGKKYGKKRNHINQFLSAFPVYRYEKLTPENCHEIFDFMDIIDAQGDDTPMAITERVLNRKMLSLMIAGDEVMQGALLRDAEGKILAFTIGDIKEDTLFIHIEKALREAPGAFEMINKAFAEMMLEENPQLRYINREDDSGDEGLRRAKESYHPTTLLQKFNIQL